jgi:hypothetical protein
MSSPELTRAEKRVRDRREGELRAIGPLPEVRDPVGQVVIAALTPRAIRSRGKVEPTLFFPGFCQRLAELGHATRFVFTPADLAAAMAQPNSILIHLYNEENIIPEPADVTEAEAAARLVFNGLATGQIIGKKPETNRWLSAKGVLMPSMRLTPGSVVFSNAVATTSAPAWTVADPGDLDENRYNTEFIDTSVMFEGRRYFTTVRLLAVGRRIVHSFVGIRPADMTRPSVHGVTTPRNAALYNHAYQKLFLDRQDQMRALAVQLNKALGPGFYHHDLLVEADSDRIFLCETGYKFDAYAFSQHLAEIRDQTPHLDPFFNGDFARWSAEAVLAEADAA